MAQSVWLILRTAREAIAHDRPDEAHRLIEPLLAEGYRKAWKVAREVVRVYVARANRQLSAEPPDAAAAWATLISAESLNTGEKALTALRLTLTRFGLVQARGALEVGDPVLAIKAAANLPPPSHRIRVSPRAASACNAAVRSRWPASPATAINSTPCACNAAFTAPL